jgi:positive regulator of sigma E activity
MLIAIVPLLLCVVGALLYALSSNGKVSELGRILFAAGAFALAFSYAGRTVGI